MDTFFEQSQLPRLWAAAPASCTKVVCSAQWPPVIAATGLTACIRAWEPTYRGKRVQPGSDQHSTKVEFTPVEALREYDGQCFVSLAITDELLAAATSGQESKVIILDTRTWARTAALRAPAGARFASLALSDRHAAAGTDKGTVCVWRRMGDDSWEPLFHAPLSLDTLPLHSVCLTLAPDGSELLVVHSRGKNAIGVWRLDDGKLVKRLEMRTTGEERTPVTAANMRYMMCEGPIMAAVSHSEELGPGTDPVVQLMQVLTGEGELIEAPDRLQGRGTPLCADFDGNTGVMAVGCADGALVTFGYRGWLRWHKGAVGAVHVMRGRGQVVSACASGDVCVWSAEGALLHTLHTGFPVTCVSGGDVFAVMGGAQGEIQIVVIAPPKPDDDKAGDTTTGVTQPPGPCVQYALHYDLRPVQPSPTSVLTDLPLHGSLPALTDLQQTVVRRFFEVPRVTVTAEHFRALVASAAKSDDSSDTSSTSASSFNPKAALQGAKRSEEGLAAEAEAAKQRQLKQMGEGAGVARTSGKVLLPSSVELMGRKCDNTTCLVRSGTAQGNGGTTFARCGGCKRVWYCSVHCQRTHWRDAHSKQCKEWQKENQQQQQDQQAQAVASTPVASNATQQQQPAPVVKGQQAGQLQAKAASVISSSAQPVKAAVHADTRDTQSVECAARYISAVDLEDVD